MTPTGARTPVSPRTPTVGSAAERVPAPAYFVTSAVFHYLGPSFAVLLFSHLSVLGVAWLRIATAALVFAGLRLPWRCIRKLTRNQLSVLVALGVVLAAMNCCFYYAIRELPLGTVAAIEFVAPIALAAMGVRSWRNVAAFASAIGGALMLTNVRIEGHLPGFAFAFTNMVLFAAYIVLAHRIAQAGGLQSLDRLGAAMLVAAIAVTPVAGPSALPALRQPTLLLAGAGVGVCSSVIPYVSDQLAMARLTRSTFALMLSLLPPTATVIGVLVLRQVPTLLEMVAVGLVVVGVALHREPADRRGC